MKGGFSKGPVSPVHNKRGNNGGGGVNVSRAQRTSISHADRGGFGHKGHKAATSHGTEGGGTLPGGRSSKPIVRNGGHGGGGSGADRRIRQHFHGVHSGGHEHLKGKHPAGRMSHNVGAHSAHSAHPHNLPTGFGKGPVGLDD